MVQGALNATNICFEAVGEVELLSTVAARAQHLVDAGKMPDFAKSAELSAAGSVSAYANVLGKFVQCFGGGSPWAAIKYLSTFSMVDNSVSLGKEYFQAVTETDFSSTNMYPLLRLGFLCCNLTAPKAKIQDGFARLLSKSDVISCKAKKNGTCTGRFGEENGSCLGKNFVHLSPSKCFQSLWKISSQIFAAHPQKGKIRW